MSRQETDAPITSFRGPYRWLSNFWPCYLYADRRVWPSVEHFYQAGKTVRASEREAIHDAVTAKDARRLGRKEVHMRVDWDSVKDTIMAHGVWLKFLQNRDLAAKLVETGGAELIEGNNWGDTYWGVCNGEGQNKLGKLLMRVRRELMIWAGT